MEFSPEDMLLGMEETEDDGDLEAELLALTGEAGTTGKKPAPKGQGEFGALDAGARWALQGVGSRPDHPVLLISMSLLQHSHQEAILPCSLGCVMGSSLLSGLHPLPCGQSAV